MTEILKILLGSEDIVIRDNEDAFLNLELSRFANEIKPDNVDNDFNLGDQYIKERNDSTKFCIYGTVESKYFDCTNVIMSVRASDRDILITPKKGVGSVSSDVHLIETIPLSKNSSISKNLYGYDKASYFFLFEIDRAAFDQKLANKKGSGAFQQRTENIIISIDDPVKKIFDVIEIPFVFFDENGEFVPYGTKTTDIDIDGQLSEIDNDFPFLYDRHWIKTNFSPSKTASVSFTPAGGVALVPENISGGTFYGEVKLDFPSRSGKETVIVILDKDDTIRNPNADFTFRPQLLKWAVGETTKQFKVGIINDLFVEGTERVSFTFGDTQHIQIEKDSDARFAIDILNDDIPSRINFKQTDITVSQSAGTVSIEMVLDKPVEVPGQAIDFVIEQRGDATALLGVDYSLGVPSRPGASSKTIYFKQGDTGATVTVDIFDNFGYDLEKFVQFRFGNPTQNIAIGGQIPSVKLTITDSMVTQFTRYVMPASFQSGTGAFRVNQKTSLEQYQWALNNDDDGFTNKFGFSVDVINLGDPIIFEGKVIGQNSIVFTKIFPTKFLVTALSSSGMTEPIVLDLPANDTPDLKGKLYQKTKYDFVFYDISNGLVQNNNFGFGANIFANNSYRDVHVTQETKLAGDLGEKEFHLVSELSNIRASYDPNTNGCLPFISNILTSIKINGIAFVPDSQTGFNPFNPIQSQTGTQVKSFFRESTIQNHCSFNGVMLPFGFNSAAAPPYNERFVDLSFREMLVQIGLDKTANSKLNIQSPTNNSNIDSTSFFTWSDASLNFKNNIEMHITNLGSRDVKVLGKDIGQSGTLILRQSDIGGDFNNLTLRLLGNSSYSLSANSFSEASYAIAFKNVQFYSTNGQPVGTPLQFPITAFNLPASASTQSVPTYVLVSRFDEVNVRTANVFSPVPMCGGSSFTASRIVDIQGLLFTNTDTVFVKANFVKKSQDIIPTCLTDAIKFTIV